MYGNVPRKAAIVLKDPYCVMEERYCAGWSGENVLLLRVEGGGEGGRDMRQVSQVRALRAWMLGVGGGFWVY